jgi:hypothetical protein
MKRMWLFRNYEQRAMTCGEDAPSPHVLGPRSVAFRSAAMRATVREGEGYSLHIIVKDCSSFLVLGSCVNFRVK